MLLQGTFLTTRSVAYRKRDLFNHQRLPRLMLASFFPQACQSFKLYHFWLRKKKLFYINKFDWISHSCYGSTTTVCHQVMCCRFIQLLGFILSTLQPCLESFGFCLCVLRYLWWSQYYITAPHVISLMIGCLFRQKWAFIWAVVWGGTPSFRLKFLATAGD